MFKKPEDITPLPTGYMDAFTQTVNSQLGNYGASQEAAAPEAPSQEADIPEQKLEESVEVVEGTLKVSDYSGSDAGGQSPKKLGIKVKKVASGRYGDDVEMTGPDAKLIAFAIANLGVDKSVKTIADAQKQINESKKIASEGDDKELDKADPKADKKKFKDRKDKDLDNDGDTDSSDEYLHKRRQAIAKAIDKKKVEESVELDEAKEYSYTVVHAKKGKVVVTAPTSYAAAQKAAKQWKLKSTAGVDSYLMESSSVKKSESFFFEEMNPTDHVTFNKETGMYCVYDKDSKKVYESDSEEEANNYAIKNHKSLMGESVELDEALKTTHVVIDTADGNKIVSSATNEKQAKSSIVSAERPPLSIKDKKTLKVVQLKKPVSLNKDILGTTLKEEAVQLDEVRGKLNAKGEIEMTKANFAKVHKDFKTKIKGQPFAMQIDPKTGGSALFPVKFIKEEVALDEAKRVITKAMVVKLLIKRGNNPKVAKDMVEKEFDSAIKRHPDATASRIAEVISVVAEEVALDEAYQQFTDKTPNWGEDQALTYGRKKGYKEVAVMGDGKGVHGMVLFALNSEDKKFVKGANVKSGETVFRYTTKISIAGDIFPLVKVNIAKGIFYPLTQESSDGSIETAKFETRGVKLKFFRSLEGVKLESIEEARMKEGNTFTKALAAARLNGDDEFIVSGKKYKVTEHAEELDEAMGNFSVPIPKQTLNGKKLGGGQPIVVKARTAREAITKAAKQLDVDFKFLKTGKVVKEELEEAVDSADMDDMKATKGDKESAKLNIIVQLRKAADVKGNLDIVFANGKKQKLPANIIKIALDKFNSFRKPATKEKLVTAMSKSYKDMLNALKTIKEYSE